VWKQEDPGKCSEDDEDRMVQTKTVTSYPPEICMYFFVWKNSSDDAKIVILRHQRIFWPETKDYSQ